MFVELAKLTTKAQIKILVTGVSDGKLHLLIEPKSLEGAEKSPFTSPLSLTATPEELDAELPAYLAQYADRTTSLFAQFESQLAQIETEAKEASDNAKAPVAKKASNTSIPAKTVTKVASMPTEEKAKAQQGDLLELF